MASKEEKQVKKTMDFMLSEIVEKSKALGRIELAEEVLSLIISGASIMDIGLHLHNQINIEKMYFSKENTDGTINKE